MNARYTVFGAGSIGTVLAGLLKDANANDTSIERSTLASNLRFFGGDLTQVELVDL